MMPDPARSALVTGASRGIGRAISLALADAGLDVALVARDGERLTAVAAEVERRGRRAVVLPVDVTDRVGVDAAVGEATFALGGIDLLVNNAGLIDTEVPLWEADPDEWREVLLTDVYGPFLVSGAVVPGMLARGGGRVVDLSSGSGTRDLAEASAYNVSKTALFRIGGGLHEAGFTRGLRAFEVAPGVVATDMTASMTAHANRTEWTPPEAVAEIITTIATGALDNLSGCYIRAGTDTVPDLVERAAAGAQEGRRLRITDWT